MKRYNERCIISKKYSPQLFDSNEYIKSLSWLFSTADSTHTWIRSGIHIPTNFKSMVSSYRLIADCTANSAKIEILLIKAQIGVKIEDSEKILSDFVCWYMGQSRADITAAAAVPSTGSGYAEFIAKSPRLCDFTIPQDILAYMCTSAIKNFLRKACSLTRTALDGYFSPSYALYDDTIIRSKAKMIDTALSSLKFCDIAAGDGSIALSMAEAVSNVRLSLNRYLAPCPDRTKESLYRHFITNSLYATDCDGGAIQTLRTELMLLFPEVKTKLEHLVCGSILTEDLFREIRGGFDIIVTTPPHMRQELFSSVKEELRRYKSSTVSGTDLYCYYAERALELLAKGGSLALLMSNRWMRTDYGQSIREIFASIEITNIVDFGSLTPIEEYNIPTAVISAVNTQPESSLFFTAVDELTYGDINIYAAEHTKVIPQEKITSDRWIFNSDEISALLNKISLNSDPLGKIVSNKIYRGILTGLNEAFVVNAETAAALIALSPQNREIIRPFLSGRNVRRFEEPEIQKYLIFIPKGYTDKKRGDTQALEWFASTHTSAARYLAKFEAKAARRSDKGDYWWELRPCKYYDAFEVPKIICPSIVKRLSATMDNKHLYANDKTIIIPVEDYCLLGLINSKLMDFCFRKVATELKNEHFELKPGVLSNLPIHKRLSEHRDKTCREIGAAAIRLSELYSLSPLKTASLLHDEKITAEKNLNRLVYRLYKLTPKEIALIENY